MLTKIRKAKLLCGLIFCCFAIKNSRFIDILPHFYLKVSIFNFNYIFSGTFIPSSPKQEVSTVKADLVSAKR